MKHFRRVWLIAIIVLLTTVMPKATAQTINTHMGKPTAEELEMTVYAPDSAADAVMLHHSRQVSFEYIGQSFRVHYHIKKRIKVLSNRGTEQANISIPYYESSTNSRSEKIVKLQASSYNLQNGKTVQTRLEKEAMFEEQYSKNYKQLKFTVPQVRKGSIIEYEYHLYSEHYYSIDRWEAQLKIPVVHTECEIEIPEYFVFNVEQHGSEQLKAKQEEISMNFRLKDGELLQCSGTRYHFEGQGLSALLNDDYVWCADNYRAQVNFDLRSVQIPGTLYKNFTKTWDDIDRYLNDLEYFGNNLKMRNPLADEMALLPLAEAHNNEERAAMICRLLYSRVKWNKRFGLTSVNPRKAVREGTGNNADLNFVLISMLRDAGITAYPVVMSERRRLTLPYTHPSIENLNTFIVGIALTDSTMTFMDASAQDDYFNILATPLLTKRARIIIPHASQWVNLQQLGENKKKIQINAAVSANGEIKGVRSTHLQGQYAATIRRNYRKAKDSLDFVNTLQHRMDCTIESYHTDGMQAFSPVVKEEMKFTRRSSTTNHGLIYINPMVFIHTGESPFKADVRTLPVEFAHLGTVMQTVMLEVPEGYTIEELPGNKHIVLCGGAAELSYRVSSSGNQIMLRYIYRLNRLLFTPDEYADLKTFWEIMATYNRNRITLKRKDTPE